MALRVSRTRRLRLFDGRGFVDPEVFVILQRQFRRVNQRHAIGSRNAHLRSGDPAIELPFLARSLKAGMVVMGAVSRSAIKRLFIGNTAERVLDSLTCDVLIVKPTS
jgi:nucleotide-binding universal stress UspA family protein